MIEIALRFDDPSPISDHALERRIFDILRELKIPATVAVVPNGVAGEGLVPLSSENVPHLVRAREAGILEIAQHGYAHEQMTITPKGLSSEFWGVPATEQARRIDEGHRLMSETFGQPIHGFIPPWNTYDTTTAALLTTRGYRYISGSLATPPENKPGLCLIPRTCGVDKLHLAYAEARSRTPLPSVIIAIMHHYDFQETRNNAGQLALDEFRRTLSWLKAQSGVTFRTLGQLAEKLGVKHSHAALERLLKKEHLHWRIQRCLPQYLLLTYPTYLYLRPPNHTGSEIRRY